MKLLKHLLLFSLALSVCLLVVSCNNAGGGKSGKPKIAVVPKGTSHNFWLSIKAGAEAAGQELGAEILWKGPATETDYTGQVNIVEDFVNKQVDGIVLAPSSGDALVTPAKKAKAANIPVVVIDSGINWEDYVAYISTDNRKGGEIAAERMAEILGGKGNVAILGVKKGSVSTDEREDGFQSVIKNKYPNIKIVDFLYGEADRAKSADKAEDIITRHTDLNGIFASNESSAVGALRAINVKAVQGKVKLVGFDSSPDLVAAVKGGIIDSLVVQDPYKMGYEGVKAVLNHKAGKPVERRLDTGVELVKKDNLDTPKIQNLLKERK
ncbi:MAG TPA: substrate-binding domain-containing protein [Blastocatellia bacterium]|nr:substrate-binding domain-containing protein [Blastocatellia bacterium]